MNTNTKTKTRHREKKLRTQTKGTFRDKTLLSITSKSVLETKTWDGESDYFLIVNSISDINSHNITNSVSANRAEFVSCLNIKKSSTFKTTALMPTRVKNAIFCFFHANNTFIHS